MGKAKYSDGFNIKMAISDAIPVLFFGFGAILLTSAMNSKIILCG